MSNSPPSSPSGERREGPANRRMLERAPASDRRLANENDPKTLTSEDVHFRPPLEAGAADPPTENTQLLFERS